MATERKGLVKEELERLEQMRDELRLQAHLFRADMKDEWKAVEERIEKLRKDLHPVRDAAETTLDDVSDATRMLFDSVRDGMKRLRDSVR